MTGPESIWRVYLGTFPTPSSEWRISLMDTEQTPDSDVVASLLYCTAYNPVSCLGGERIWPEHCLLNFEASVLHINPMQIQVKALVLMDVPRMAVFMQWPAVDGRADNFSSIDGSFGYSETVTK